MIIERMSARLRKKKQNRTILKTKNLVHDNMTQCLDIRNRTSSFDLHEIGQETKTSFLSKLFRSKSESSMKKKSSSPGASPKTSPKASPGAPRRRRFVRVIKNDEQIGEEYINPHVVRKYEKGFWENKYMRKSASLDEPERKLPYTVTGQTILKKAHSIDLDHNQQSPTQTSPCGTPPHMKSCSFAEEVEVVEFDTKDKSVKIKEEANITHEKLREAFEFCIDMELLQNPYEDKCPLTVSIAPSDLCEANYRLDTLEVIDEHTGCHDNDGDEGCHSDSPLRDNVFLCDDTSDTESATNSSNHTSDTKDSDKQIDAKEITTSPTLRKHSDEGISAPKKCKTSSTKMKTDEQTAQTSES